MGGTNPGVSWRTLLDSPTPGNFQVRCNHRTLMKNPTITRLEKLLTVQADRRDKRQRALRSLHQRTRETERQQDGGGQ